MTDNLRSYGKVYNLGHRATKGMTDFDCIVEEKIDGSQFSFGLLTDGTLSMSSKRVPNIQDAPPKLFLPAVQTVREIADRLEVGTTYRCEAVCSSRHSTLKYNRVPAGFIVLFDIDSAEEDYVPPARRTTAWWRTLATPAPRAARSLGRAHSTGARDERYLF